MYEKTAVTGKYFRKSTVVFCLVNYTYDLKMIRKYYGKCGNETEMQSRTEIIQKRTNNAETQ